MKHLLLKTIQAAAMSVVTVFVACGPASVEDACTGITERQCAMCFACDVDGAQACGLAAGTNEAACVEALQNQCVDQAATLERPKDEIGTCDDSLDQLTCETIVRAASQDAPHTTTECAYFL